MKQNLAMDNVIEINGDSYFLSYMDNYINRVDTLYVERLHRIPFQNPSGELEYSKIYHYRGKIFALPWFANDIAICNLEDGKISYIKIPDRNTEGLQYFEALQNEEFLYLFPCGNDDILVIDMEKEEIVKRIDIQKLVKKSKTEVYCWGCICMESNNVIAPLMCNNRLLKFNIEQKKGELFFLDDNINESGFAAVCKTEGGIWFIPKETKQIYFKDKSGLHIYNYFPNEYRCGEISFYKCVPLDKMVYLLPRDANMFLVINEDGEIHKICDINPDKTNSFERYMFFSNVWRMKNKVYCIEANTGKLYEIVDNKLIEQNFNCKEDYRDEILDLNKDIFRENVVKGFTLKNFLKSICG